MVNKLLKKRLDPAGYFEVLHTPGLWTHITYPVQFILVVDDFGVKVTLKEHDDHLVRDLKKNYNIPTDWTGGLYYGLTLQSDYEKPTLDFSKPRYIKKLLQKYKHEKHTKA